MGAKAISGMWTGTCGATAFIMVAYGVNVRCKCTHPVGSTSKACEGPAISASVSVSSSSSSCDVYKSRKGFVSQLLHVLCCLCSAFGG